jgi:hypothetical protein
MEGKAGHACGRQAAQPHRQRPEKALDGQDRRVFKPVAETRCGMVGGWHETIISKSQAKGRKLQVSSRRPHADCRVPELGAPAHIGKIAGNMCMFMAQVALLPLASANDCRYNGYVVFLAWAKGFSKLIN